MLTLVNASVHSKSIHTLVIVRAQKQNGEWKKPSNKTKEKQHLKKKKNQEYEIECCILLWSVLFQCLPVQLWSSSRNGHLCQQLKHKRQREVFFSPYNRSITYKTWSPNKVVNINGSETHNTKFDFKLNLTDFKNPFPNMLNIVKCKSTDTDPYIKPHK